MAQQFPLREQRKAATRERLVLAARDLFLGQGYEATTLEAVAERAGVHVQTLYRHFDSKVELAAAGDEVQLAHFRDAIRDDQRKDTTVRFWRDYVEGAAKRASEDGGRNFREVQHQYADAPALSMYFVKLSFKYKALLAESLERDIDLDDSHERRETARLIAITLWGAHEHVLMRHERRDGYDLAREMVVMIDRVEQLYQHLLR